MSTSSSSSAATPSTQEPAKPADRPQRPGGRGFSTIAVHAGEARQKSGHAMTDAIYCASTFTFSDTRALIDYVEQEQPREEYGRYGNPSEKVAEKKLAALDGAEDAILFASGMAAVAGLLMAKVDQGDEVVFFDECYHRSREFCVKVLGRYGVVSKSIKTGDYDAMEAAVTPRTKILVSESPTNPHQSCVDIERFADIGRRHGVETMIDSTLATPYNLRPAEAGVDYVLHSCTKYLGGHNDLLAGSISGSTAKLDAIRKLRGVTGNVSSPHNVYLLLRGLKTFELRMQRHNENGLAVARFLEAHPRVEKVYYPGLESHRDHEIAKSTMSGYGGLITFLVRDADWRATADVIDAVQIPRIGPSLGGAESLIEQPLFMSYHSCTEEQRREFGIPDNMIRLSCGIENAEDLIADLDQALRV